MRDRFGPAVLAAILAVAVWSAFQIQRMVGALSRQQEMSVQIRSLMEEDSKMASITEEVIRTADSKRIPVTTIQQTGETRSDWYARHLATCQQVINGAAP